MTLAGLSLAIGPLLANMLKYSLMAALFKSYLTPSSSCSPCPWG
jgi:hypothetical protein